MCAVISNTRLGPQQPRGSTNWSQIRHSAEIAQHNAKVGKARDEALPCRYVQGHYHTVYVATATGIKIHSMHRQQSANDQTLVPAGGLQHAEFVARWVARWLQQLPAHELCVDKPLAGRPQQPPDSVITETVRDS